MANPWKCNYQAPECEYLLHLVKLLPKNAVPYTLEQRLSVCVSSHPPQYWGHILKYLLHFISFAVTWLFFKWTFLVFMSSLHFFSSCPLLICRILVFFLRIRIILWRLFRLSSRETKTAPTGRRLEGKGAMESGGKRQAHRWLEKVVEIRFGSEVG